MQQVQNAQKIERPRAQQTLDERFITDTDSRRQKPKQREQDNQTAAGGAVRQTGMTQRQIRRARNYRKLLRARRGIRSGNRSDVVRVTRAVFAAGWFVIAPVFPFQFIAGITALLAFGAEAAAEKVLFGFGAALIPADELLWVMWAIGSGIAVSTLVITALLFATHGVRWWQNSFLLITFIVTFLVSLYPLLLFLPLVPLWIAAVWYTQK